MKTITQSFNVKYNYKVIFTDKLFSPANTTFVDLFKAQKENSHQKILFVLDEVVFKHHPELLISIKSLFNNHPSLPELVADPLIISSGEIVKNEEIYYKFLLEKINEYKICRHSYVAVIGGGALLDMTGFAAAIAHRGVRLIRIPTTVLSQDDSGVGVKNAINFFGKKNFIGTFAPPFAVINDFNFLRSLSDRDWKAGISEAIKVGLIKDANLFYFIRNNVQQLLDRDMDVMKEVIERSAELHLNHIASGDPFESGSARPLDFGHWSAHKLESIKNYSIRHGEAVAIGIAIDSVYSWLSGRLSFSECREIIETLQALELDVWLPEVSENLDADSENILDGINDFREHLGGELSLTLLSKIGTEIQVNTVNPELIRKSIRTLQHTQLYKQFEFKLPERLEPPAAVA